MSLANEYHAFRHGRERRYTAAVVVDRGLRAHRRRLAHARALERDRERDQAIRELADRNSLCGPTYCAI